MATILDPALGKLEASKLTAHHLDALYASLSDRGLAPASVRQVHAIVRAACMQGVRWGLLATNPAQSASPPKIRRKREVLAPSVAQVRVLIETASSEDEDMAALIALAAVTGARRGELLGLRGVTWTSLLGPC